MTSNVAIAIPTYGGIPSNFYDFTINLISTMQSQGIGFSILTNHNDSLITRSRNLLITDFYNMAEKEKFTHFLFIDSDVNTDPSNIIKLIKWTEKYEIDVIGAVVPLKGFKDSLFQECQTFRLMYEGKDIKVRDDTGLMKVDFLTTGMILLTKKAVDSLIEDAIKKDCWYHRDYDNQDRIYDIFQTGWVEKEVTDEGKEPIKFRHYLSEDWFLCNWLRELGFDIIADIDIRVFHRGYHDYNFYTKKEYEDISYCKSILERKNLKWGVDAPEELKDDVDFANSIEGFMTSWVGEKLYQLAKTVKKKNTIVEIGSYKGRSTSALCIGSKIGNNSKVYAIDPWENRFDRHESQYEDDNNFETFRDNMKKLELLDSIGIMKTDSVSASVLFSEIEDKKVGLLYIDGGHRYEDVKADFEAWKPYLAKDAYVLFHDYTSQFLGVMNCVNELEADGKIECIEIIDDLYVSKKL